MLWNFIAAFVAIYVGSTALVLLFLSLITRSWGWGLFALVVLACCFVGLVS
jgi:hypothetical protein